MKRIISMLAVVALLVALSAVPAFAVSPSQQECEAAGGTFTRTQGEVQCVIVEEGKNPKFTQETSKKGSFQSSHEEEDLGCSEANPGNSCPRGQFE